MTKEEIIKKVKKFQGANREFSQELPPIIDAMLELIDEAGPEVVDNLESNSSTKALSAKQGKELKIMNDGKLSVPSTAGEAGQILQLDANAEPEWVTPASVGATYDSEADDTSTNAIQNKAIKKYVDDTKAAKDGYYASLTSGAAENLVGRGSVPASFLRRTTGGSADVGTGSAKIAKLMGNSIVWNQLANMPSYSNTQSDDRDLFDMRVLGSDSPNTGLNTTIYVNETISAKARKTYIVTADCPYLLIKHNGTSRDLYLLTNIATVSGHKYYVSLNMTGVNPSVVGGLTSNGIMVIDLTLMFSAGNEPSTVDEFEALYPLDYYAYNTGEVLPFAAEKLVTTGFNQWDEEWENGVYNTTTGEKASANDQVRSKNKIPCFGSTIYYFKSTSASGGAYLLFYDANKNYISFLNVVRNRTFTTPSNARYIAFYEGLSYGSVYNHDICINLSWSGYRNGEYEPYELHEAIFDPANWEDANGNKIFPYGGMHGKGNDRDYAIPDADGFIRKATRIWDRRAYAAGDESDSSVITDGSTYTFEKLATPVEIELAEPVATSYYANDFGTEEWTPANDDEPYTTPCEMQIAYVMNAVDTLRRLPENYMGVDSFGNFCDALASSLGAALNKSITITPTYDAEDQEYDFAITIEDIEEGD